MTPTKPKSTKNWKSIPEITFEMKKKLVKRSTCSQDPNCTSVPNNWEGMPLLEQYDL
jgi:hypothetical protein